MLRCCCRVIVVRANGRVGEACEWKGGGVHHVSCTPGMLTAKKGGAARKWEGGYVPPAPLLYAQKGRAAGVAQRGCKLRGLPANGRGPHHLSCAGMRVCGARTVKEGAQPRQRGFLPWATGVAMLKGKAVGMGCKVRVGEDLCPLKTYQHTICHKETQNKTYSELECLHETSTSPPCRWTVRRAGHSS
jgi:hypothetical protein